MFVECKLTGCHFSEFLNQTKFIGDVIKVDAQILFLNVRRMAVVIDREHV